MRKLSLAVLFATMFIVFGCRDYYMKTERITIAECYGKKLYAEDLEGVVPDGMSKIDSLQKQIDRDSLRYVHVHNGYYQRGDNRYVDQTEWQPGVMTEFTSTVDQATNIVNILEVRQPEPKTLREAKGLVTADYQAELEEQWMNKLHSKYPVKINEKVLDKVRKLYQ